jgi:hypothetical protein
MNAVDLTVPHKVAPVGLAPLERVERTTSRFYPTLYRSSHGPVPVESKTDIRGMSFDDLVDIARALPIEQRRELVLRLEAAGEVRTETALDCLG